MSPTHHDSPSKQVLVLDNGGHKIKAALLGAASSSAPSHVACIPNAVARVPKRTTPLLGTDIDGVLDYSAMSFRRPVDRGFVTTWDLQFEIWTHLFHDIKKKGNTPFNLKETALIVTEPPANHRHMRNAMNELVFEYVGFTEYAPVIPQELVATGYGLQHGIVLDVGFSNTHAVPILNGRPIPNAIRRLNVGGKLLTNVFKQWVSFRHWNMMDESVLMEAIKENSCFVSQDFRADLKLSALKNQHNTIKADYVLPTFLPDSPKFGYLWNNNMPQPDTDQILPLNNERISLPEILFNPSDIGLMQCGVSELVLQSAQSCPWNILPALFSNVLLTGGSVQFPGFTERLYKEIREMMPIEIQLKVSKVKEPIFQAMNGGIKYASSSAFLEKRVTKEEYQEHGHNITYSRFR